jgi:DNA-binding CsgD family transcriptional regulator
VLAGEVYLPEKMRSFFLKRIVTTGVRSVGREIDRLAARELEVLALSGRGRTTREIAAVLQLSIATVGTYRARIKEKMKFRNTEEFHHFAIRWVLQRKWRVCVMNAPLR